MNNFTFYSPTEFVFGKNTEQQTGELVKKYHGTKALIVYGGGSVIRSGLLDRVKQSLEEAGIAYIELGGVQPNPTDPKVYEGIELGKREKVDFLLPVGGGSVIDTAKAIAAGIPYESDFWDFFTGKAIPQTALRIGVVFAVMNPEVTYTLPAWQTASGITDMMAHIMERYFTNTPDTEVTDRLCEGTLKAIIKEARTVMKEPHNYGARANIMWAGTIAHNGICGTGREEDWASHFMEHEISALYDVTHGAGLAVIFPAWLTYMANHNVGKVAQFAERVWDVPASTDLKAVALEGIARFKAFLHEIGMPTTFKELGIEHPDIDLLVAHLHENKGELVGGYVRLDRQASRAIYEIANS